MKEGNSAVWLQSGLDEKWGTDSIECFGNLRNVQDSLADGKTSHERRFGEPLQGPTIPFEAMVEYHPISKKDQSRLYQFGRKVLPGIFLGCASIADRIWNGDILIADMEDMGIMLASEIHPRRDNAEEVLISKK